MGRLQLWLDAVRAIGIESIICLCTEDQIHLYPGATLIEFYEVAGFHVCHIPVEKGRRPPLNQRQLAAVLEAWRELPKPVLVHCSAGLDRTDAAIEHILNHRHRAWNSAA
jgi:protein-tyrosine phosphatase